jgi:hypothetical protein
MQVGVAPISIGFILAIIALILVVVFVAIGQLPLMPFGVILALLCIARLC